MKVRHIEYIYRNGFSPAHFDADGMLPGLTIVKPLFPPKKTAGGIDNDINADTVPGNAAMIYEVVLQGARQPPDVLALKTGDVVILRTAHLDPLTIKLDTHAIYTKHIVQIVPDLEAEFDKMAAEEDARTAELAQRMMNDDRFARDDIERERAELVARNEKAKEMGAAPETIAQAFDAMKDKVADVVGIKAEHRAGIEAVKEG